MVPIVVYDGHPALRRMDLDTIRVFAISKLGWIKQQQMKFRGQEREIPREYLDRESHYGWGKRFRLMWGNWWWLVLSQGVAGGGLA